MRHCTRQDTELHIQYGLNLIVSAIEHTIEWVNDITTLPKISDKKRAVQRITLESLSLYYSRTNLLYRPLCVFNSGGESLIVEDFYHGFL